MELIVSPTPEEARLFGLRLDLIAAQGVRHSLGQLQRAQNEDRRDALDEVERVLSNLYRYGSWARHDGLEDLQQRVKAGSVVLTFDLVRLVRRAAEIDAQAPILAAKLAEAGEVVARLTPLIRACEAYVQELKGNSP